MSIKELIKEAKEQSPTFTRKYDYWVSHRKRIPDLDWLMPQLEDILGGQYVRDAAENYIAKD